MSSRWERSKQLTEMLINDLSVPVKRLGSINNPIKFKESMLAPTWCPLCDAFNGEGHICGEESRVPVQVPGSVFAELCLDEQRLLQREIDADWQKLQQEAWADQCDDAREPWGEDDGNDRYSN
jgi:hypothetical protein